MLIAAIAAAGLEGRLHLSLFAPAEAQVAAIADDIAYNCHDLDDGLRAGLIGLDDLVDVPLAGRFVAEAAGMGDRDRPRHLRGQPAHDHGHDRRRGALFEGAPGGAR